MSNDNTKDATSALRDADCSASEHRGTRCPICFWALYDGDWCQGPQWCANRGKSVKKPIHLTNAEAMEMISHYCQTCGRNIPCRHCEPNAKDQATPIRSAANTQDFEPK